MLINNYGLPVVVKLIIKYIFIFFICITLLIVNFILSGEWINTPVHSPPISGAISISENKEGKLCFTPDFNSTSLNDMDVNVEYIYLSSLTITNISHTDHSTTNISIQPRKKNYILKPQDSICLDSNNPKYNQYVSVPLKPDSNLIVFISGEDDKRKHYVDFSAEFVYLY